MGNFEASIDKQRVALCTCKSRRGRTRAKELRAASYCRPDLNCDRADSGVNQADVMLRHM